MGRQSTVKLSVQDDFSGNLNKFSQGVNKAAAETTKLGSAAGNANKGVGQMGNVLSQVAGGLGLTLGIAGLTAGIVALGKESLELGMKFEQTKIGFTTLMGSADEAQKHLDALRQFAMTTPFQFNELTDASKRMQAFGFAAKDVIPMMTNIGDAVSALGAGQQGIDRVVTALGQMSTHGAVNARTMMEMTTLGIPAWKYLASAMGMTTAEVVKMSEKGLIPADKAIQAILAGMNKDFGGMMANQAGTAAQKMSNLVDQLEAFGTKIGTAAIPSTNKLIDAFSFLVKQADIVLFSFQSIEEIVGKHGKEVEIASTNYKDYSAELIRAAGAAGMAVDGEGNLVRTMAVGRTMRTEVIQANYLLSESMFEVKGTLDRAKDGFRDASTAGDGLSGSMNDLASAAEDAKDAEELLNKQTKELQRSQDALLQAGLGGKMQKIYEDFSKGQGDAAKSVDELKTKIAELNKEQGASVYTADELLKLSLALEKAQYGEADAGNALWQAQQNLNDNTDPTKQEELERAVRNAQLAYDDSALSTRDAANAYDTAKGATVDNTTAINDANAKLDEQKQKAADAAESMHKLTNEMIFQQASIGLGAEASLELGRALGLIDDQSYAVAKSVEDTRKAFDLNGDGMIDATENSQQYIDAIKAIAGAVGELQNQGSTVTVDAINGIVNATANAKINVDDLGNSFDSAAYRASVARDRASELEQIHYRLGTTEAFPSGGATHGGAIRVERDEIVVAPKGGQVLNKQEAAAAAGGGGGKSVTFNISMNISNDMDAQRLVGRIRQAVNNA